MDYSTLIQNFINRKVMRGKTISECSYGNMKYRNDVLYSYSNPLVVRQKETEIYFLNSDMVSNTTGRHVRHAIWGFRAAKVALIEVSGGALESILGYRSSSWSGGYFDKAINNIELIQSDELANTIARLPENSTYLFKKEIDGETKTRYFRLTGQEIFNPTPEKGTYVYNGDIEFDCTKYRTFNNRKDESNLTRDAFFENFIKKMEKSGWMYSEARSLHLSSAIVFRSKYRQFESLFDGDNGYSNDIAHKNWYYYYGGFDERQYFIAALPREVNGIEDALWSLKPQEVIAYENGKTAAMKPVLRQGEWFFVPSEFKIAKNKFKANALPDDGKKTNSHVCRYYVSDGNIYVQDTTVYHRNGSRSTGEHAKVKLVGQYLAYKNTELDSRSSMGKVD